MTLPCISNLSDEDINILRKVADKLGLALTVSSLSRHEKYKRFFVKGRRCRVVCGNKSWDAVVSSDHYTRCAPLDWFYINAPLVDWELRICFNGLYLTQTSQLQIDWLPDVWKKVAGTTDVKNFRLHFEDWPDFSTTRNITIP